MSITNLPSHHPEVVELAAAFHSPNGFIHAGQAELEKFPDNRPLKAIAEALGYARSQAESINELRTNPHDEDRAATHDRKVRERCDAFESSFAEKFDNAKAGLQTELKRVETGITNKAGLAPNAAHFDAITSAFHMMKPGKRVETIAELLNAGDHASLATLIEAPSFLTGLSAAERDAIRERVFAKVDSNGVALRDHLKVVLGRVENAANASLGMFSALRSGTAPGAWKDRARDAAARDAVRR